MTLQRFLEADGRRFRVDRLGGNLIDANAAELARCVVCGKQGLVYLPLRADGRFVALVMCRDLDCSHVEEWR